jgi:hypothetical protein
MRILVIGGMHGNEPLGLAVVKLFQQKPVQDVDVILANKQAIEAGSRYTSQDLNRSFPGDDSSKDYEPRRAAQLLEMAKRYDFVLDFHNTYCPNNDCGFLGQSASELLYKAPASLNLCRLIVADYDCINKYSPNCLSVEVSLDSLQNNPEIWYKRITQLSRMDGLNDDMSNLEKYRFVYRLSLEDRDKFALGGKELKAFEPISDKLANKLGVKSPAYPIFIADKFTPYNYGGLLNKL